MFLVGTVPALTIAPLLATAVMGSLQTTLPEYSLAIWHGFNAPLIMSIIAFILGIFLYTKREKTTAIFEKYFEKLMQEYLLSIN